MASTIGKFRKATETEKQAWEDGKLKKILCPLRGFIIFNTLELAVEKASGGFLKVHAPDGQHFSPDLLHTMLCDDMDDLRDWLSHSDLEVCSEECR
jgi:hypothetical protein